MPISTPVPRLAVLFLVLISFTISGCGSMPWNKKNSDEDLVFEEEFQPVKESDPEIDKGPVDSRAEDDFFSEKGTSEKISNEQGTETVESKEGKEEAGDFFFEDEKNVTEPIGGEQPVMEEKMEVAESKSEDDFFGEKDNAVKESDGLDDLLTEETPVKKTEEALDLSEETSEIKTDSMEDLEAAAILGETTEPAGNLEGFDSIDQKTDQEEIQVDIQILQSQQEALIQRVKELQKVIQDMEPRLTATQERLESNLNQTTTGTQSLSPEIEKLKQEIMRLNEEIGQLKESGPVKQTKLVTRKPRVIKKKKIMGYHTPPEYDKALQAYRSGNFDESIMLFQEYRLQSPPENLQDNVLFWLGNNYYKLGRYDEALSHFEGVLDRFPKGNKTHDSRYMMGVTLQKMGDTGRALDTLETALKKNPPADVRKKILEQLQEIK